MKQAGEDADYLMIQSSVEVEDNIRCIVIVFENIDLMIILAESISSSQSSLLQAISISHHDNVCSYDNSEEENLLVARMVEKTKQQHWILYQHLLDHLITLKK